MKHNRTAWTWFSGIAVMSGIIGVLASCGDSQMALAPQAPRSEAGRQADCNVQVSIVANAATLGDKSYSPNPVTIARGATVTWTNNDTIPHTVTARPDATLFDSGSLAAGATYTHTFDTAGSFDYFCTIHPGMTGTVVVSDAAGVCPAPSVSALPSGAPGASPSAGTPSALPSGEPSAGPGGMTGEMPGMEPNPQMTVTVR